MNWDLTQIQTYSFTEYISFSSLYKFLYFALKKFQLLIQETRRYIYDFKYIWLINHDLTN